MVTKASEIAAAAKAALNQFAATPNENRPEPRVVEMAARIVAAALRNTTKLDISFDDEDVALSFDLDLPNGYVILAELWFDGNIDASVYNRENRPVKRMPKATETDIIALFQE